MDEEGRLAQEQGYESAYASCSILVCMLLGLQQIFDSFGYIR